MPFKSRKTCQAASHAALQKLVDIINSFLFHESHFFQLSFLFASSLLFFSLFSRFLFSFHFSLKLFDPLFDDSSVVLTHSHCLKKANCDQCPPSLKISRSKLCRLVTRVKKKNPSLRDWSSFIKSPGRGGGGGSDDVCVTTKFTRSPVRFRDILIISPHWQLATTDPQFPLRSPRTHVIPTILRPPPPQAMNNDCSLAENGGGGVGGKRSQNQIHHVFLQSPYREFLSFSRLKIKQLTSSVLQTVSLLCGKLT